MKIAFIDLTFHWPASGGSWIDLYEVMSRLQTRGYEVKLFVPRFQYGIVPRGMIQQSLSFPVVTIPFTKYNFNFYNAPRKFREEIKKYNPDIIFIGDAYTLKPYFGLIFQDYPVIQRFFGHEVLCPNYIGLIKNGEICNIHLLKTPFYCTQCAIRDMIRKYRVDGMDEFIHEFILGLGFMPNFLHTYKKSLRTADAIVVYNQWTKDQYRSFNSNIHIIPGGVDTNFFKPLEKKQEISNHEKKKIIFMPGRIQDWRKGIVVMREAVNILSKNRDDFKVRITDSEKYIDGLIESTGWLSREELRNQYQNSDICVIPVIWHEPFGLVAVEAMSCGLPVIASDIGGFRTTIRENITGYKIHLGDGRQLADKINHLMDHPEIREGMGKAGRKIAEDEFDWNKIIEDHYIPLFESLLNQKTTI